MKRLLIPLGFIFGMPFLIPSSIAEDITLSCKMSKYRKTFDVYEKKLIDNVLTPVVVGIKKGKWEKHNPKLHGSPNKQFKFDEEKGYIDVYFANPDFNRGTKEVTFQPDLIAFTLPREEYYEDSYYLKDNYKINRNSGQISRELKTIDLNKIEITSIIEWEGNCKKAKFKRLF